MRAFFFVGWAVTAAGVAAIAGGGCGGRAAATGGGGHSSSSPVAASTTTSRPNDDAGSGGFASAAVITVDDPSGPTAGTLTAPTVPDFYRFTGKAGDRLVIDALAQPDPTNPKDPTVIDTIVTLLDATRTVIAQNDDVWPGRTSDSQLFAMLPEDGEYYVVVGDCNSVFARGCNNPSRITTLDYQIIVLNLAALDINAGTAQDGTTSHAVPIPYRLVTTSRPGVFRYNTIDGQFKSATDTHVFSFTPPLDTLADPAGRPRAEFWLQPIGWKNGDGSTANVKIWVTDSTGTTILSRADQRNYSDADSAPNGPLDLSVPVTYGQTYLLFVQNTATTSNPVTDYYFTQHYVGTLWFGPKEAEGVTATGANDTPATAEQLATPRGAPAGGFFVDGNLPGTDVDVFAIEPDSNANFVDLVCDVARTGSGLVGFKVDVLGPDGATVLGTVGPEAVPAKVEFATVAQTSISLATLKGTSLDAGAGDAGATPAAKFFVKMSAASHDPTNTGTYYRCSLIVN